MTERLEVPTAEAMRMLGERIGAVLRAGDLVVLDGPLGAGKTTMTIGIGTALGVRGPVTSPTFVLARTHPVPGGGTPLTHVDAYRLGSAAEFDDLDLPLDASVVVVEWGAGLLDGLADSLLTVSIRRPAGGTAEDPVDATSDAGEPRQVTITGTGSRWAGTTWSDLG